MIYAVFLLFTFSILLFAFYQWQFFTVFAPRYYRSSELLDEFEILSVTTEDGVELEGIIYEPKNPHATLLFFAGKGNDCVGVIEKMAPFYPTIRLIAFNYRSYGRSGGRVNEKNMLDDSVMIAQVIQKNYGDFYILGFSLGSSVASFVASQVSSKGVFLVGAFDSIPSLAKKKYRFVPSKLIKYSFETKKFVTQIDAKTYLFVSKDDQVTYIQNARELKKHIKNLVFYVEFDGLAHKELLWHVGVVDKINGAMS